MRVTALTAAPVPAGAFSIVKRLKAAAVTVSDPKTATSVLTPVGYGIAVAIVAMTLMWRLGRRS